MDDFVSLKAASEQSGLTRWKLLLACIDNSIKYRRTVHGVDIDVKTLMMFAKKKDRAKKAAKPESK